MELMILHYNNTQLSNATTELASVELMILHYELSSQAPTQVSSSRGITPKSYSLNVPT